MSRRVVEREQAKRRRRARRGRLLAPSMLALCAAIVVALILDRGSGSSSSPSRAGPAAARAGARGGARAGAGTTAAKPRPKSVTPPGPPFAVGLTVVRFVDRTRVIHLAGGGTEPRTLLTYVRYPADGRSRAADLPGAPPARAAGPFPLIVFGHGFAVTPGLYAHLLHAWARAGYVVAAPVFPLENADAPGGPDESDLANQPADMRVVISRMLTAGSAPAGRFSGLIDPRHVAVAGHSDGGDTALAVAYDRRFRDPRVVAAVILSGAEIPGIGRFALPPAGSPLLATQGTVDTVNPPSFTSTFYDAASRPKYLLRLLGAAHLTPYTDQQPQLGIVERVSVAFLDHYLKGRSGALQRLISAGTAPQVATLQADR